MSTFKVWDENNSNILNNSDFEALAKEGFEAGNPISSKELNTILKQNSVLARGFLEYIAECNNVKLDTYLQTEGKSIESFLNNYLPKATIEFVDDETKMVRKNQIYYNTADSIFWIVVDDKKTKHQLFQSTGFKLKTKVYAQETKAEEKTYSQEILYDRIPNTPVVFLMLSAGGDATLEFSEKDYYGAPFSSGGGGGNLLYKYYDAEDFNNYDFFNISFTQKGDILFSVLNIDTSNSDSLELKAPTSKNGGSGGGGAGFVYERYSNQDRYNYDRFSDSNDNKPSKGGTGVYGGGGGGGGGYHYQYMKQSYRNKADWIADLSGGESTGYSLTNDKKSITLIGGSGGFGGIYENPYDSYDSYIEDVLNKSNKPNSTNPYGGIGGYYYYDNGQIKKQPTTNAPLKNSENISSLLLKMPVNWNTSISILSQTNSLNESYPAFSGGGGMGSQGGFNGEPCDRDFLGACGGGGGGGGIGSTAIGGKGGIGGNTINFSLPGSVSNKTLTGLSSGGGGGGGGFGAPGGNADRGAGGGGGGYGLTGQGGGLNQKPGYAGGGSYAKGSDPIGGPGVCIVYYYSF